MKRHTTPHRASALALSALALSALGILTLGTAAHAQTQFLLITLNTASLAGQMGSLDFQFNAGGAFVPLETVNIFGFTTAGGTLAGTATDTGGGTGTLPGSLSIANSGSFNDVFQGITFGSSLRFIAGFPGATSIGPVGSTFAFSVLDPTGTTTLLGTNPDGSVLDVTINPDGTLTPQSGSTALTVTPAPIPEASTTVSLGLLLVLGGGAIALRRRRTPPAR